MFISLLVKLIAVIRNKTPLVFMTKVLLNNICFFNGGQEPSVYECVCVCAYVCLSNVRRDVSLAALHLFTWGDRSSIEAPFKMNEEACL